MYVYIMYTYFCCYMYRLWSWAMWFFFFLVTGSWLSSIVFLSSFAHYFACIMTLCIICDYLEPNASWQRQFSCSSSLHVRSQWGANVDDLRPILFGNWVVLYQFLLAPCSVLILPLSLSLSLYLPTFLALFLWKCEFVLSMYHAAACMWPIVWLVVTLATNRHSSTMGCADIEANCTYEWMV